MCQNMHKKSKRVISRRKKMLKEYKWRKKMLIRKCKGSPNKTSQKLIKIADADMARLKAELRHIAQVKATLRKQDRKQDHKQGKVIDEVVRHILSIKTSKTKS